MAAALVAGALGTTAGVAQAAPQQDDFTGGTLNETALIGGGIELATFDQSFDSSPGWTTTPWSIPPFCPNPGGSSVAGGVLTVDGARTDSGKGHQGSSLKFTATFRQANQHVGFGVDFNDTARWAMFSTWNTNDKVYARINTGTGPEMAPIDAGVTIGGSHEFRIDWTASGFAFFVDGNPVAVPAPSPTITAAMTAQVSDCTKDDPAVPVTVDSMHLRAENAGTYTSKVFEATDARVGGIQFAPAATTATGQAVTYKVRSGNTPPTGDAGWVDWSAGSTIAPGKYFQYRATLTTNDIAKTPKLNGASVDFQPASDPQPGTGNPPASGGGNTGGDTKKPKLGMPRDADVNKRGKVRLLLTCPDDETRCNVALKFKWNGDTVASKSGKIDGGDSRYISLKLSKAAKKKLAKAGKLKVVATLTVTDAAGNKRTSSKSIWLYSL